MTAQILLSICILIVLAWVCYISLSQEKEFKPEEKTLFNCLTE